MKLTRRAIEGIFNRAQHQQDYVYALYRVAIPFFEKRVVSVQGYPATSKKTGLYIMALAMRFDREHHPNVLNGGLWMSVGFSSKEGIPDWTVDAKNAEVVYEQPEVLSLS